MEFEIFDPFSEFIVINAYFVENSAVFFFAVVYLVVPKIIQIDILKILTKHINGLYQLCDGITIDHPDYKNIEVKTYIDSNQLVLTLCLVCKDWLDITLKNINVSVNFNNEAPKLNCNFNNDNIKILKLNYFEKKQRFYNFSKNPEERKFITLEKLSKKLNEYQGLEKIIIRNCIHSYQIYKQNLYNGNDIEHSPEVIRMVRELKNILDSKGYKKIEIILFLFRVDTYSSLEMIRGFYNSVCQNVMNIAIVNSSRNNVNGEAIKMWYKTIKKIIVVDDTIRSCNVPYRELVGNTDYRQDIYVGGDQFDGDGTNYLEYIRDFKIEMNSFLYKELALILKYSPNLEKISLKLCIKSLIYYLSNENDLDRLKLKLCTCSPIFVSNSKLERFNINDKVLFQTYWEDICASLKNHKNLNHITLNHSCFMAYIDKVPSQSFVCEFISMLSNTQSLKSFSLSGFNNEPPLEISQFKDINQDIEKTVTQYFFPKDNNNRSNSNNISWFI
ncbi:hypothetical protein DICPUDRAFT_148435 [Dictyostelium purpureum]|uniref:F-box domain-containing protein n=1 Tax=Dictyostelium purpureum TaxID=5786 RepID=F0ZB45_DICPU|nr:uncharacterized protein DICPUDRAFT_148435 [Dictyostelium purpureum]EGC38830.1 hypothetical protein DICPUDRAFT_148435 [Dictyostelium purpureum]|eukprot:XP_003284624.1 hypothetical protein DICPUDRAFT_148435 [Dictyostelium purpureum]